MHLLYYFGRLHTKAWDCRSGGSFPLAPPARAAMRAGVIFVDLRVLPLLVLVAFLALFLLPVLAVFCPLGLLTILPSLSAQL